MTNPLHCTVLGLALLLGAPTHAASPSATGATGTTPSSDAGATKPAKAKKKSASVKHHKGSGESAAEQGRRLQMECKGRPNSGACLGYAS